MDMGNALTVALPSLLTQTYVHTVVADSKKKNQSFKALKRQDHRQEVHRQIFFLTL
jgi:hypothetical protein